MSMMRKAVVTVKTIRILILKNERDTELIHTNGTEGT